MSKRAEEAAAKRSTKTTLTALPQYCYKVKWHHFSSASGEIVCPFFRKLLVRFRALWFHVVFFSYRSLLLLCFALCLMWPNGNSIKLCDLVCRLLLLLLLLLLLEFSSCKAKRAEKRNTFLTKRQLFSLADAMAFPIIIVAKQTLAQMESGNNFYGI